MSKPVTENGTISNREYERLLSSIRSDARKMRDLADSIEADGNKLADGGHPAPSELVIETAVAIRVVLRNLREVFRVDI